jgi:hypothetical protein
VGDQRNGNEDILESARSSNRELDSLRERLEELRKKQKINKSNQKRILEFYESAGVNDKLLLS